jgi:hypothetical protein
MADRSADKPPAKASQVREDRLKAALKANMARRKAQARGRADVGVEPEAGRQTPDHDGERGQ